MDTGVKVEPTRQETALFLVAALAAIYAISQFLRNSIGVIANDLARELDLRPPRRDFCRALSSSPSQWSRSPSVS